MRQERDRERQGGPRNDPGPREEGRVDPPPADRR